MAFKSPRISKANSTSSSSTYSNISGGRATNYNTFGGKQDYCGLPFDLEGDEFLTENTNDVVELETYHQLSSQTQIPFLNDSNHRKRHLISPKCCENLITNCIRKYAFNMKTCTIYERYSFLYSIVLCYCMERHHLVTLQWRNDNKSSVVKLLNTNQTFMINSDKFKKGKKKQVINFMELNRSHSVQLLDNIPGIAACNLFCVELEVYQKYIDWKRHDKDIHDHKLLAMCGSHKIGITATHKKHKYFVGLLSYFNYTMRSRYNKHKENGTLYKIDVDGTKSKINNEMALRKHELITMTINWIAKQLVFTRISNENGSRREIVIELKDNKYDKCNIMDLNWRVTCCICLNDIDSFMWSDHINKDFITYTLNGAYLL
eukprot:275171_1